MDKQRWQQIKALFQEVLDQPPERHAAYLDEAWAGDEKLREEVEALLASDEQASAFMETPAALDEALVSPDEPTPNRVGERIGAYRLTDVLGRGGMGTVYRAERADGQFEQEVAVKLVRSGVDHEELLRRFRYERQILASLQHPNIARLFDGGVTEDGVPYLVMEYVEGIPITDYCDERHLSMNQRLALFRTVCAAVHHAHQNLVVHRDLKPSNILVTSDGQVKLLDFGIAKLLDESPEAAARPLTRTGMRVLTLEYASPEQVRGEPISTASDVYALGVILYELLTGRRPYHVRGLPPSEVERVICETTPAKPSTAVTNADDVPSGGGEARQVTPDRLRRRLSGDLDNIVMMALRKEPARRYGSVERLSEDLRRHLDRLPVMARPDTLAYRTGTFIRRHKISVVAAGLILLTLIGGIATTTWQARIAATERDRAEQRFNEVRELAQTLLFDLHDAIGELPGSTPAREMLVTRALDYLDNLAREAEDDRSLQLELAEAYERVGEIQGHPNRANLGDVDGAEQSYRKALAIRERLRQQHPSNDAVRQALGTSHTHLGAVLTWSGDNAAAMEHYRTALDVLSPLVEAGDTTTALLHEVARAHNGLGDRLWWAGDTEEALRHLERGQTLLEDLVRQQPGDDEIHRDLANVLLTRGNVIAWEDNSTDALVLFDRALHLYKTLHQEEPNHPRNRRGLWLAYLRIGENRPVVGDPEGALDAFEKALGLVQQLAEEDPENATAHRDVSLVHGYMGDVLVEYLNRPEDALPHLQAALTITERLLEQDPENVALRRDLSAGHKRLGEAFFASGDLSEALKHQRKSTSILEALLDDDPKNTGIRNNLAANYATIARVHRTRAQNADDPTNWQEALTWYEKSTTMFGAMKSEGKLLGYWETVFEDIAAEHEQAEKVLARLDQ